MAHEKNPHAVALGTKGGLAKSKAKSLAAKKNIKKRWDKYRAAKRKLKKRVADTKRLV